MREYAFRMVITLNHMLQFRCALENRRSEHEKLMQALCCTNRQLFKIDSFNGQKPGTLFKLHPMQK